MINVNVSLDSLSNADLLSATRELVARSHVLEAELLMHLGEIDERRLYLDSPFPSMFAFCVDELGFSEDAAYNRITVARAGRRLPAIIDALRSGRVHLAGLRLLAPHLTELNHELVLPQAAGKSKRDIEELVARLAPAPPVRTGIRRVPECAVAGWSPIPATAGAQGAISFSCAAAQTPFPGAGMAAPGCSVETAPPLEEAPAPAFAEPAPAIRREPRCVMAPLSGETFKVQFTATREMRDKLLEARALLRHRVPDGDFATILEKGLDLLIESVKKERFAIGRKVRAHSAPSAKRSEWKPPEASEPLRAKAPAPLPAEALAQSPMEPSAPSPAGPSAPLPAETSAPLPTVSLEQPPTLTSESPPPEACTPSAGPAPTPVPASGGTQRISGATSASDALDERTFPIPGPDACVSESRHIPDAIKRAVYERDGGRCTFVDDQGRRCGSTEALEFDHVGGFARTHEHRVEGIRLLCRAHNQREAEKMYGREFMERARAKMPPATDA